MPGRFPPPGSTAKWAGRAVANARHWYTTTHDTSVCARCGQPITGPWHLGHKLDRQNHPHLTWHPDNWQAEHPRCSTSAGATQGNRRRRRAPRPEEATPRGAPVLLTASGHPGTFPALSVPGPTVDASGWPEDHPDPLWGLPKPPADGVWPRLMTGPHPRAVGTYGPEFLEWARERFGMHPKRTRAHRWWQELVAYRALEHDADGRLVWRTVLLSTSRQVGKSWLLRELCLWRLAQAERLGEVQTVVHAAAKLAQAYGVWRPASRWARHNGYEVRLANGEQMIGAEDGSQWLIQAANDDLGVSQSVSLGLIDEAWRVRRDVFEQSLEPTGAEAEQSQMWLVSTAGVPHASEASDLMPVYRGHGLAQMLAPGSLLMVEWSAPWGAEVDDPGMWRLASPHWTEARAELVAEKRAKATTPQALAAFQSQWLNIWSPVGVVAAGEKWLPEQAWEAARFPGLAPSGWVVVAVEDRVGGGGFAAAAWVTDDGRPGVVAAEFDTLDGAWAWGDQWSPIAWLCGMSLRTSAAATTRGADKRGSAETASALPGFRELVRESRLWWDSAPLADNVLGLRVQDNDARSGLSVVPTAGVDSGPVRCAAWAVDAVQRQVGAALSA